MDQANQNQIHQMRIKNLSDTQLLEHLQRLFNYEKKLNQALLLAITELNQRKIFLEMGYSSLFDMLVRHFRLSESSAYQKISTMKLMIAVPKTQEFIQNGDLSLTNAAMAQSFITQVEKNEEKKMTVQEKQNIISAICHKTQKEAQAILAEIHPLASLPNSLEKQITAEHTQIQILINQETNQKLQELKSLYSHQIPDGNLNQLFSLIIDIAHEKHPLNRNNNSNFRHINEEQFVGDNNQANFEIVNRLSNQELSVVQSNENETTLTVNHEGNLLQKMYLIKHKDYSEESKFENTKTDSQLNLNAEFKNVKESTVINKHSHRKQNQRTSIPISKKRIIFTRANGQCEYRAPNGQRCHSHYQLEYDHIQSVSHGGTNSVDNLQLLCRQHNQYKVQMTHGFIYQERMNQKV